jgi:hypothetical protein
MKELERLDVLVFTVRAEVNADGVQAREDRPERRERGKCSRTIADLR